MMTLFNFDKKRIRQHCRLIKVQMMIKKEFGRELSDLCGTIGTLFNDKQSLFLQSIFQGGLNL